MSGGTAMRALLWLLLAAAVVGAPFLLSSYEMRILVLGLQSAIAVIGLLVAFGWAGLIQLGQAAFVGIGAYASGYLSVVLGLNPWLGLLAGSALAGLAALVIAVPMLRLRGHYLALATVGLNITMQIIARNWVGATGGDDGQSGIPSLSILGWEINTENDAYLLSLAVLVVVASGVALLRASRFGRAMIAVRDDELACAISGVRVVRVKVLAFVLCSVLGGLSGALYAHFGNYVAPQDFELVRSITLLVMLILGGETSIIGAIIGAILLSFAPEWLRPLGNLYLAVFGLGILLLLIFMPGGLAGRFARLRRMGGL